MNRSFFYKVALILVVLSLVPLVIFLSRREGPPKKISVKVHQRQTVENFVLNSTGEEKWVLKSPLAVFKEKNLIELQSPVLKVFRDPPIVIEAERALFNRAKGELRVVKVKLKSGQLFGTSQEGTYFVDRELFTTNSGCLIKVRSSTTTGKNCTLKFKEREVIISQNVRTLIDGE